MIDPILNAIDAWYRQDVPLLAKVSLTTEHVGKLEQRLRGQYEGEIVGGASPENGRLRGVQEAVKMIRCRGVQAIGAGLSRRDWHATETAYNELRDRMDDLIRQLG